MRICTTLGFERLGRVRKGVAGLVMRGRIRKAHDCGTFIAASRFHTLKPRAGGVLSCGPTCPQVSSAVMPMEWGTGQSYNVQCTLRQRELCIIPPVVLL